MYHGVSKNKNVTFNKRHVSVNCFERQLKFLKKYTHVISVQDYFENKFIPGKPNCALTFDDGYLNNYINAKPLLEQYQCPATFYVTGLNEIGDKILWPDFLNIASQSTTQNITIDGESFKNINGTYFSFETENSLYNIIKFKKPNYTFKKEMMRAFDGIVDFWKTESIKDYWELMSNEDILQTSKSKYINIGSHGYYHNNLGAVDFDAAKDELTKSKNYLEKIIQKEINEIAYPDGSYTQEIMSQAYKMGLKYQLATENYINETDDATYIKNRLGIYNIDSSINQVLNVVKK